MSTNHHTTFFIT